MAFDISIGETTDAPAPPPPDFDSFVEQCGPPLAHALRLAIDDDALAARALRHALTRTTQRWKKLHDHVNLLGWAFGVGVDHAAKVASATPSGSMNEATGGYVRGLPLDQALAALPLHQRAALVGAYHLGWTDEQMGAAFGSGVATAQTRRTRALTFLAHHRHVASDEAIPLVVESFGSHDNDVELVVPGANALRNTGRRKTLLTRLGIGLLVGLLIAAGATLVQVSRRQSVPVAEGPKSVPGPSNSAGWLAPVADGQGGFMALNTIGSSRFVTSVDGETWFEEATWNSRAVDLRTEVTSFTRTGNRYIATVEAADSIRSEVPLRIASTTDLETWTIASIELPARPQVDGLRSRPEIAGVAAAGSTTIVGVEWVESVDYRALDLARTEVCVEVAFDVVRALYQCNGGVVTLDRAVGSEWPTTEFLVSVGDEPFESVALPLRSDPRTLVSYGTGFAVADSETGRVSRSTDGRAWAAESDTSNDNQFALLQGNSLTSTMLVQPSVRQWQSVLRTASGQNVVADVGLAVDPAVVWTKPDLAVGPAGWALFVTTSRPWERGAEIPGWAVRTGNWVVSRLPDSDTVTAQDRRTNTTYRFNEGSDALTIAPDGSVSLVLIDRQGETLDISRSEIDQSRAVDTADESKAQVFFSSDGRSWRSIWETDDEAWFGTVAVGDSEVLISGVTLTGAPIVVPIGE